MPGRHLVNMYGPAESTILASVSHPDADGPIVIGRPLLGTAAVVLDDNLTPVVPGVIGELYLTGVQLAVGYLGRPDSPLAPSSPARTDRPDRGCTPLATSCGGAASAVTGSSNTWDVPTSR